MFSWLRDELARLLQNVARVRSQRHVDPELLIAGPSGLLAGDAIETRHEIERLAERLSGIVGQRRVQERVRDRVERRLLGQAERAETLLGGQVLAQLDVHRARVGVEDPLPVGVEFDVPVSDRPHDDARIDQRTAGPFAIDADDAKSIRLAAQIHAHGHARSDALRRDARHHVAADGCVDGLGRDLLALGWSIPAAPDGLPALLSYVNQSTR